MSANAALPIPVKSESRVCFGIKWFDSEADAVTFGEWVTGSGQRYNGGFYDGMLCGRDSAFDFTDADGRRLFAVTVA